MEVSIRRADLKDVDNIMLVIKDAQNLLASEGIDQWQDGFPNEETIKTDVSNEQSYVMEMGDKVVGFFVLQFAEDRGYDTVYEGEWIYKGMNYASIHRTAISNQARGKGLAHLMFETCENEARNKNKSSIRIDTHEDNKRMERVILREGYEYCGYILLERSNDKRIIFEKIL